MRTKIAKMNVVRKWNVIIFKDNESELLLSMIVPIADIEKGSFNYWQEIAIDGVAYDVLVCGTKLRTCCKFDKVRIFEFNSNKFIRDCEIVKIKGFAY